MLSSLLVILLVLSTWLGGETIVDPVPSPPAEPVNEVGRRAIVWKDGEYPLESLDDHPERVLLRTEAEWSTFLGELDPELSDLSKAATYMEVRPIDFDGAVAVVTETTTCQGHHYITHHGGGVIAVDFVAPQGEVVCDVVRSFSAFEVSLDELGVDSADDVVLLP